MKKKLLISLALVLCLVLSLGIAAFADNTYVYDQTGALSAQQLNQLNSQAGQIADSYGCAPYIIIVSSYKDYGSSGDIYQTAMDLYSGMSLGSGQGKNGLLLLLSMNEREYGLATYGILTHQAFTDYGQQYLQESFLDNFRNNDWYGGFSDYLSTSQWLLQQAANGKPYDVSNSGGNILFIVGIPLVVAAIVCIVLVNQMKTAKLKTQAKDYVNQNGVHMRVVQDFFTHRTVTRRVIERDRGGGGGHGGTSVNSRGFSGGRGRF